MIRKIKIGNRYIGVGEPCFIVAEAGANHEGDFRKAKALIDAAAKTQADSIKFQHYTADKLVAGEAKRYWKVRGDEEGFQFDPQKYKEDQRSTFAKIDGIPRKRDADLITYGAKKNLVVFSTPFDFESVDHLDSLGVPMFKIASGDLTYHQLLDYVARKGKPVVLSTGAADLDEIRAAVEVIKRAGNDQIILLHCTLAYPTPLANANLLMMRHLMEEFPDLPVGFSDHTPGPRAAIAAAMLGAAMIEKHFTHTPGPAAGAGKVGESPDHDIGIGLAEFLEMVRQIRANEDRGLSPLLGLDFKKAKNLVAKSDVAEVLGRSKYKKVDLAVELKARAQARRSVITGIPLSAGTIITRKLIRAGHLDIKRPGTGVAPYEIERLVGKMVNKDVPADSVLHWHHFDITPEQITQIHSFANNDVLEKSDAVIYLEGDSFARVKRCVDLHKKGYAPIILVSGTDNRPSLGCYPAPTIARQMIKLGVPKSKLLLEEKSINTRDQAIEVMKIARDKGWQKIILVTSLYHQPRAYLTFVGTMQEMGIKLKIINDPVRGLSWFKRTPRGTRLNILRGEIEKINLYLQRGHLADWRTVLSYERWKEKN